MTTTLGPRIDYAELWEQEFLLDLNTKRTEIVESLANMKSRGSYRAAHEHLLRLYDAAIAAVDAARSPATDTEDEPLTHASAGFCEFCWGAAYMRMLAEPSLSQADHYAALVAAHADTEGRAQ